MHFRLGLFAFIENYMLKKIDMGLARLLQTPD